ncbi:MAG: hypothetical protein VW405_04535 [Rhodospirillaceae bacterium]
MVGVADITSGGNFAKAFAETSLLAGRPQFELQFNVLQNTIIDRLNEKIDEVTADDGLVNNIDPFLVASQKKLNRFQAGLDNFIFDNGRNINAVSGLSTLLDDLETALNANDTDGFNDVLGKINQTVGNTHLSDGTTVGIFIDDGITKLRREGLVTTDSSIAATSRSDFADAAAAQAAIDAARNQLGTIAEVLVLKQEGAENLEIETALIADQADKANAVSKVREEYSQLLNALSLAFESSQAIADQLAAKLFDPNSVPAGSAVNILL